MSERVQRIATEAGPLLNARTVATGWLRWMSGRWAALSLAEQYIVAALVVLCCGMAFLGVWMSKRSEAIIVQNTAEGAAPFITSLVEPHLAELARQDRLSPQSVEALNRLLKDTLLQRTVVAIKVWMPDGTMAYSNNNELIGQKFDVTSDLRRAFNGEILGARDLSGKEENDLERRAGFPLFEIYLPIRSQVDGKIFAVTEFYEDARRFEESLRVARLESWAVPMLVTLVMLCILFTIVKKGNATIESQQEVLRTQVTDLVALVAQNQELQRAVEDIIRQSVETNDLMVHRLGLELHDGPAQLISLALLRLDSIRPRSSESVSETATDDFERIRLALADSLSEIRNVSAGLVLPELDRVSTAETILTAVRHYERLTGIPVTCKVDQLPDLPNTYKSCLYRVTQEGLNNGFRHAKGAGQRVFARQCDGAVELEVVDSGSGFDVENALRTGSGLGLRGMWNRTAMLGGTFQVKSSSEEGTRLIARFELETSAETPIASELVAAE
jgi:signal transduction histidine kinase